MTEEQENYDSQNFAPLSSEEIKSILKSQSESNFEEKNISNNSNFVKKSLIDIAFDFQSNLENGEKVEKDKTSEDTNSSQEETDVTNDEQKIEEVKLNENNDNENKIDDKFNIERSNNKEETDNSNDINLETIEQDIESEKLVQGDSITDIDKDNKEKQKDAIDEIKTNEDIETDNETQQALDSVRDAVSQSMNKNQDEVTKNFEDNTKPTEINAEKIIGDYDDFKNILSSLSALSEEAIYKVFQDKILEISNELAGYQIDKMPEKYEKKIRSFIKNINCYEDKITIEVNDKDFEALSKIKNFNKNEQKNFFVSNKDLSRGDLILNCDGMQYSEKSVKSK